LDLDGFSSVFQPSSDPGSDPDPALIIWMAEELSKFLRMVSSKVGNGKGRASVLEDEE
jgi:hypothetical protein